jgi:hypothetical protein
MMPELEPIDPMEALQRIKQLAPGTQITILRVEQKNSAPWFEIRALSSARGALGSGWINSIALMGQSTIDSKIQLGRQFKKESELTEKYKAEIEKRYGISKELLQEISLEGLKKNWPMP